MNWPCQGTPQTMITLIRAVAVCTLSSVLPASQHSAKHGLIPNRPRARDRAVPRPEGPSDVIAVC